jgi:predicted O-methyltransferase YrrM
LGSPVRGPHGTRYPAGDAWVRSILRSLRDRAVQSPARDGLLAAASLVPALLARAYAKRPSLAPRTGRVWEAAGVLPVPYHFYQPVLRPSAVPEWGVEDPLVGVDIRADAQLRLLAQLEEFASEVVTATRGSQEPDITSFDYGNESFGSGDAEVLYEMVRLFRPARIVEVGAGHSTRMIRLALNANARDGYYCNHTVIEPYPQPWLGRLGAQAIVREKVERTGTRPFEDLGQNDIVFIDTSHVVRMGGDVQHLYLRVLPSLRPGVLIHVHDIFLPRDYPREWVADQKKFWTEQYLLQAFLAFNSEFEVLLALAYLSHHHHGELCRACPIYETEPGRVPGSFWMRRRG